MEKSIPSTPSKSKRAALPPATTTNTKTQKFIAAVRLRGAVPATQEVSDTLDILGLRRVNSCIVFPENASTMGMLHKAQFFVTWGIVSEEVRQMLIEKRGKGTNHFRLSPTTLRSKLMSYPRGDLGFRGEKINQLLKDMM